MPFNTTKASGKNWGDYQKRDAPLANAANVLKSYGWGKYSGCGERTDIDLTYAVQSAGASINFTQNTAIAGLRYYNISVCDGNGNEAYGQVDINATTTLINIVTSNLNPAKTWVVNVSLASASVPTDCNCPDNYTFEINSIASNPTDTIETAETVGALSVAVDGVTVADGGTATLAAATVGDVVVATLAISNSTANSLVTVLAVSGSGDGSFTKLGVVPFKVDDTDSITAWHVTMDTSSAAVKTFSVVITSDAAVIPYNVDIEVTVS
jgi:hypothetical protein